MDIDARIREAVSKKPTLENLNLLGDLYLKKGDREKAVDYLFQAAKISHRNRAIAIYKKILNIAPSETKAYEALIDIFSHSGLIAEEIRYLLILAEIYRNRGDVQGEADIFRRINALDRNNAEAKLYFSRGKADFGEVITPLVAAWERKDEFIHRKEPSVRENEAFIHGEEPGVREKEEVREETAAVEEKEAHPIPHIKSKIDETAQHASVADDYREQAVPSEWWRKPLIITGLVLLLITGVVVVSAYLVKSFKDEKGRIAIFPAKGGAAPSSNEALWTSQTRMVTEKSLRIEATYLTDALLKQLPVSAWLTRDEMRIYGFYLIAVTPERDCISEAFGTYPSKRVSVIDKGGNDIPIKAMPALDSFKKVIYKPYVCGGEKGIVYMRFYIAFPKAESPAGVVVDGVTVLFEKKS
jgi:tetratricopeptide (TPR) repeat protein